MAASGTPSRILIIKTHAIGDLLLTTPAIRDIRNTFPSARITLLVGSWSAPAIRKNPHIDEFLEVEDHVFLGRRTWLDILRLLLKVRKTRFDCAFVFHPLPMVHLFALLAGIPLRYGLTTAKGGRFLTKGAEEDLREGVYYAENFQAVAALAGVKRGPPRLEVHADADDEAAVATLLSEVGLAEEEPFLLVAPGGGRNSKEDVAAKRWPAGHFISLLRMVQASWPGLRIVLTGSAGDAGESAAVGEGVFGVVDLTGRTTLGQLFCLAGRAKAVVCNDSALLHIAVARGVPAVVPFGPTSLERFVPEKAHRFCVKSDIACSPCYVGGRFPGCAIGFRCMREITPENLLARLKLALESPNRSGSSSTAS